MEDKEIKEPKKKSSSTKSDDDNCSKNEELKAPTQEIIVEKKIGFNYLEVILIMIITLIVGGFLGSTLSSLKNDNNEKRVENIPSEFQEFIDTYEDIKDNYYEELNSQKLLDAGIKGMLDFLGDKYSLYMDPSTSETFNEEVEGKYRGIGVQIVQSQENQIVITRVFRKSAAEKAGLQVGDIFQTVNGESVEGKSSSEVSSLIKDNKADQVKVAVKRENDTKEFTVAIEQIETPSVESELFEKEGKKIGYLYISVFAANTYEQFLSELAQLEGKGIDRLIIDVRDNSGGYLNSVTSIASLFLEKGKIVYQLDTKGIVERIMDTTKTKRSYPVVVLVNQNSASASEILATALKESYGADVVGTNTYGKGTVQRAYELKSGATVKYTIQKWLTPRGNWINEIGVEPTKRIELNDAYFENPNDDTDNQLQEAFNILIN